jgi:hypothetical protein
MRRVSLFIVFVMMLAVVGCKPSDDAGAANKDLQTGTPKNAEKPSETQSTP